MGSFRWKKAGWDSRRRTGRHPTQEYFSKWAGKDQSRQFTFLATGKQQYPEIFSQDPYLSCSRRPREHCQRRIHRYPNRPIGSLLNRTHDIECCQLNRLRRTIRSAGALNQSCRSELGFGDMGFQLILFGSPKRHCVTATQRAPRKETKLCWAVWFIEGSRWGHPKKGELRDWQCAR